MYYQHRCRLAPAPFSNAHGFRHSSSTRKKTDASIIPNENPAMQDKATASYTTIRLDPKKKSRKADGVSAG
jgi:hypothetical protein